MYDLFTRIVIFEIQKSKIASEDNIPVLRHCVSTLQWTLLLDEEEFV